MNFDWSALHRPMMHWPIWHVPQIPDWCVPIFLGALFLWIGWSGLRQFEKGQMTVSRAGRVVYRDKQPILFWSASAFTAIQFVFGLGISVFYGQELIQQHLLATCNPKDTGSVAYYNSVAANCEGPALSTWATSETMKAAHESRGFALFRASAYQPAIGDLSAAIALEPKDQWAFYTRGLAYARTGKLKDAVSDYDEALNINPDDFDALQARSEANLDMGQATKAIADMNRIASVRPNDPIVWRALSLAHAAKGDCVTALGLADKSISLGDKSFWPYEAKAHCYDRMGRTDEELDAYAKAIIQAPKDPNAYAARADVYFKTDNYDAAIEDLTQALQIAPKNLTLLYRRCWFRALSNSQLDAALDDCNEALKANANSQVLLETRILALYRLKRYAEVESECNKLLAKYSESSTAFYIRGLARKQVGNKYADADIALAKELNSGDVSSLAVYGFKP